MVKTNKEILSGFGEEMNVVYKEKEERLKKLDELGVSESIKRQAREDIVRDFDDKMKEIEKKPGYEGALKSARREGTMKHKMHKAEKAYQKAKEAYKEAKINYRGKIEEETEVKDMNEKLYGDKEKILKNLKQNIEGTVEENVEMMGYKGKKVHIKLPEIKGKFEGYNFDYFVSYKDISMNNFDENPELEEKSYSMKDVGILLKAMNKYMQVMGVETDGDMDYENDLQYRKTNEYECKAGDCLRYITGLDVCLWLKDKYLDADKGRVSHVKYVGINRDSCFYLCDYDKSEAKVFLVG